MKSLKALKQIVFTVMLTLSLGAIQTVYSDQSYYNEDHFIELNFIAMDDDGNGFPNASLPSSNELIFPGNDTYPARTVGDIITILQVLAGGNPDPVALNRVEDLIVEDWYTNTEAGLTLADGIMVLRELADLNDDY
jgi:hypothetical protein